jgi:RNA polymerase sigma factor (sigma-70 family)
MKDAASLDRMAFEPDQRISEVVERERPRLRNFIRHRVPDPRDVEDVLQDVFYELVEANRLLVPIEHVTGWLFRVARNRIVDLFRKRKPESLTDAGVANDGGGLLQIEDLLPSPDLGRKRSTSAACFLTNWNLQSTNRRRSNGKYLLRTSWKGEASRRWPPRPA